MTEEKSRKIGALGVVASLGLMGAAVVAALAVGVILAVTGLVRIAIEHFAH